jgi:hypothetical protein
VTKEIPNFLHRLSTDEYSTMTADDLGWAKRLLEDYRKSGFAGLR